MGSNSIGEAYGGYRGFLALRQRGGAGEVANHHVYGGVGQK